MKDIKRENIFLNAGHRFIVGLDEAGRGPWAGPVVAAALVFNKGSVIDLNDSKKMTEKQREKAFTWLIDNFDWGIGLADHKEIDTLNILSATKLAMVRAIANLKNKPDYLLIDGTVNLNKIETPQESVIKGDQKIWTIAAASVIAKVTRDRMMIDYHKKFPHYGFDRHKGYGTKAHRQALKERGPCSIHRKSFRPIADLL